MDNIHFSFDISVYHLNVGVQYMYADEHYYVIATSSSFNWFNTFLYIIGLSSAISISGLYRTYIAFTKWGKQQFAFICGKIWSDSYYT